jgi:hypothetical protein
MSDTEVLAEDMSLCLNRLPGELDAPTSIIQCSYVEKVKGGSSRHSGVDVSARLVASFGRSECRLRQQTLTLPIGFQGDMT